MAFFPSSLGKHVMSGPTSDEDLRRMARRVWRDRRVAVLWVDEIADPWQRQAVENVANETYGRGET